MVFKLSKPKYRTTIAITIYLQIILWGSLVGLVVSLADLAAASVDITLRPAAILLFVSSFLSLVYLTFHTITARRRVLKGFEDEPALLVKRAAYIVARLTISMVMSWLITSGWNLIVAAREPICLPDGVIAAYWEAGGPCIAQRFGTAVAIIMLITSCALFGTLEMSRDPLKSHLFGITRNQPPPVVPVAMPRASIHQRPFPRPGGLTEKWARSPPHSPHGRSNSKSSITLRGSMRAGDTDAIGTVPMTPAMTGTTLGLGAITMGTRGLGEFPVDRPGSAHNSPSRGSVSPPRGTASPARAASRAASTSPTRNSQPRTPPPARILRTSHSTTSLASAASGRTPYRHHRSGSGSTSSLSLPGFTPLMPLRPPPTVSTTDSAWKAVHPPAHQFQHVSSTMPYVPFAPKTVASGVPVTYGNIRAVPMSKGLGLGGSRAPSIQGGHGGNREHSRSRSSSSSGSNAVAAWVGTQQRSALNTMTRPSTSGNDGVALIMSGGNEASRPSTTSGSGGVKLTDSVIDVDAMLGPPPQRTQDLDLAIKLEKKLQEVQAKLERQGSERSAGSGSSYSLGEIEREIGATGGMKALSEEVSGAGNGEIRVGGRNFKVK